MRIIRVTNEGDGEIAPRMYSYWPNSVIVGNFAYVFCGRADGTPLFFEVDVRTGGVIQMAPPALERYSRGETEGWYWDAAARIYIIDGPRLHRIDPRTGEDFVVLDVHDELPGCDLWQAHSSDDGRVHSATVRRVASSGPYVPIGTVVQVGDKQHFFKAESYTLDESQVTSDGRYLIIKSSPNDDNLIVNLTSGPERWQMEQRWLTKAQGALGHSDVGPSFIVGADRDHEPRACVKWDLTKPLTPENRILLAESPDWSGGDLGHVSVRAGRCIVSDTIGIWSISITGGAPGKTLLHEHGMIGDDYDHQVKANLSPCGRVACYMTNSGTERQDVYLLVL